MAPRWASTFSVDMISSNLARLSNFFWKDFVPSIGVDWLPDNPSFVAYTGFNIRLGIQTGTTENGFLKLVIKQLLVFS